MSLVDLEALAALPGVVRELQDQIHDLQRRLTVAERRPYSVAEAARALGISEKTVRRQCDAGKLQHQRTGARLVIYLPA